MNVMNSFFYKACEWIMRLALVNLLWIVLSFLGLVILGFFPSTTAMFSVVRKWIMGQSDIPIFKTFWNTFKHEWMKSNFFGGLLVGIGFFIYIELSIVQMSSGSFVQWSKYPVLLLAIMFFLSLLYSFPSYVHYDVTLVQVLKHSFFIMLLNPLNNVVMILGLALITSFIMILPPLVLFFGGSVSAFVIMWSCYQSFSSILTKEKAKALK